MNEIRRLFPGALTQTYLDIGVCGLLSSPVRAAVDACLDAHASGAADKEALRAQVEDTRARFACFVGASADEIAITKNVSEGLNLFAGSLPWRAGENVVACPALEHPNNVYLWYNLRERRGVEVREVEPAGDRIPVDRLLAAVDERTRLVTCSHVTFAPGFVTDVETLAREARARGVLTLVDGAQSVGAMKTDVRALAVDAFATATQKSLLALYGFGFLYVRRELADTLVPGHVARYGIDLGREAHETALGPAALQYQPGARRFDLGNYNYVGSAAAGAALRLLNEVGIERVERHVRGLAYRLAQGFLDLGLPVVGGAPGPHLAHIVSVGQSGGGRHYTADDPAMNDLHAHLTARGVRLSIRRGVLRFAVGLYNDDADIDRVISVAGEWTKARSEAQAYAARRTP